jgi:hypothetical protein
MKKIYLSCLLFFFLTLSMNAQKTIAVLTGSNWTFYTDFSTALKQCAGGSTIYLPGGSFQLSQSTDTIDKQLTIIGVGHYPDSTTATNKTTLIGSLLIGNGADYSSLIGLELTASLQPNTNTIVTNFSIFRCKIRDVKSSITNSGYSGFINNLSINQSVLYSIQGVTSTIDNIVLANSIVENYAGYFTGATIRNCVLPGPSYTASFTLYENNIFLSSSGSSSTFKISNCQFKNNIFLDLTLPVGDATTTFIGNYLNQSYTTTFTSVGNNIFSYSYDYHLLSTSVGKNAGTDGTDIGIYGTAYPYKPSAVPANPHISFKSISPSSAPNGTLPVNIRVIAQDR